jgi:F-type H+-transporting ATPase subunit b
MPNFTRQLALVWLVLLAAASPLLAAGGGADLMEIRADTAIWSIIVFVALFAILYFKAWPQVLEGLQKREKTIRSSLEQAEKTRAEMVKIKADFQKDLAEAHQKIPALMEEARRDAEAMSNDMRTKAAADIAAERQRLRHEVEVAKDQAIKEMWEQAAQLATLISAKAIGKALSEDDHRRLLDEAVSELSHATRN